MVIAGDYSVRLVKAATGEPFREHTGPDGKCYSEVEQQEEYFVGFENSIPSSLLFT